MRRSRPFALAFVAVTMIGLTVLWAQSDRVVTNGAPLDPSAISVRLELGVGDREAQD
jgi:hypothetical protein